LRLSWLLLGSLLCLPLPIPSAARGSGDAMTHYIQGLQSAEEGNLDAGIAEMRAALEADSTVSEIPRELARLLIENRMPEEAVSAARHALRLAPGDAESFWILGRALILTGKGPEAIAALRRARDLDPGKRDYEITLLMALESQGDLQQALDLMTPASGGRDPDSPPLYVTRGNIRARLGQDGGALDDFVRAIEIAPGFPGAADRLLALCWRLGPSDSTASALARAVAKEPDRSDLRRELARCLVTLNREDEALPHLEWLHDEHPRDAAVQMQLGVIFFGKERLAEAIQMFRSARAIDPALPEGGDWLWRALNRADSLEAALAVADTLIQDSPGKPYPHWYRAISLARMNRPDEALASLAEVNRLEPNDREARLLAAAILEEGGKIDAAREELAQVLTFLPADREVLFRLGVLDEKAGRIDESIGWFRRLIEANPKDAQALNYAGYMLADRGIDLETSFGWISRAVAIDGENGAYRDSYGWVLYRLGRFPEAVEQLERAAALEPAEAEIQIHLAKAYRSAGRGEEGRRALQQLLRAQPNDRRARELLQIWSEAGPDSGNRR
jgi:tetratricopeptide (TPR) repeat protein